MAIDPNTLYGLKGSQVEDLARRINASGSGIIELTSEDYDYPVGAADGVALWVLDEGIYFAENGVKIYGNSTEDMSTNPRTIIVTKTRTSATTYTASEYVFIDSYIRTFATRQNGSAVPSHGGIILLDSDVVDNLNSGAASFPLSAKQGAVLKKSINGETVSYSIGTADWTALASSDPYDYEATIASGYADFTANTITELLNDDPVLFATHGFAIASMDSANKTITLYSIGLPSNTVTLKVNYKEPA